MPHRTNSEAFARDEVVTPYACPFVHEVSSLSIRSRTRPASSEPIDAARHNPFCARGLHHDREPQKTTFLSLTFAGVAEL